MGGYLPTEESAQRFPPVRDIENKKPVGGDGFAHQIDVLPEHRDRVRRVQWTVIEYLTGDGLPLHLTPGERCRVRGARRGE